MVWTPYVGEELILKTEDTNLYDKHAVAAMKDDAIVGHMPRSLSGISWFFLKSGGHITCEVTGHRKLGKGLEVPCEYTFIGSKNKISKIRGKITDKLNVPLSNSCPY